MVGWVDSNFGIELDKVNRYSQSLHNPTKRNQNINKDFSNLRTFCFRDQHHMVIVKLFNCGTRLLLQNDLTSSHWFFLTVYLMVLDYKDGQVRWMFILSVTHPLRRLNFALNCIYAQIIWNKTQHMHDLLHVSFLIDWSTIISSLIGRHSNNIAQNSNIDLIPQPNLRVIFTHCLALAYLAQ